MVVVAGVFGPQTNSVLRLAGWRCPARRRAGRGRRCVGAPLLGVTEDLADPPAHTQARRGHCFRRGNDGDTAIAIFRWVLVHLDSSAVKVYNPVDRGAALCVQETLCAVTLQGRNGDFDDQKGFVGAGKAVPEVRDFAARYGQIRPRP